MLVRADARQLPLPDRCVHAIVCDPPYELGFMARGWDRSGVAFDPHIWAEALRVAIPGAHLLAFGGTRTYHRLAVAIEDAGWEIRDSIGLLGWTYGQGFPKSHNIGKAIDKTAGAERRIIGRTITPFRVDAAAERGSSLQGSVNGDFSKQQTENGYRYTEHTVPATDSALQWEGWGTALKPAWEPIIVARAPFTGTVAGNVLANGVGGINIDACRIGIQGGSSSTLNGPTRAPLVEGLGRWPTNVLLSHHPECAEECQPECHVRCMGEQSGYSELKGHAFYRRSDKHRQAYGKFNGQDIQIAARADSGTARYFPVFRYQAKANNGERPELATTDGKRIMHPTVKPLALVQWLVRLITPPGGIVLDQFAGTGTTAVAATAEGFDSIAVELDPLYCLLARQKLAR